MTPPRMDWLFRRAAHMAPSSFWLSKSTGMRRLPSLKPTRASLTWAVGMVMLRMILVMKVIMMIRARTMTAMMMMVAMRKVRSWFWMA